jgi:hypothetical protein
VGIWRGHMSRFDVILELFGSDLGYRGDHTSRAARRLAAKRISGGMRVLSAGEQHASGPWYSGWFQLGDGRLIFQPVRFGGKDLEKDCAVPVEVNVETIEHVGIEQPDPATSKVPDFVAQPFAFLRISSGDESVEISIRESDVDWLSEELGTEIR